MNAVPKPSLSTLRNVSSRRLWCEAIGWSAIAALVIALPTVLVSNSFFTRMTPVPWWDYLFWFLAAPLIGTTIALMRLPEARQCHSETGMIAGGGLTYLAVGCPICNKVVVALLGVSGALTYFAPLQPFLGALALLMLGHSMRRTLAFIAGNGTERPDWADRQELTATMLDS